jgi:hypothetical protein
MDAITTNLEREWFTKIVDRSKRIEYRETTISGRGDRGKRFDDMEILFDQRRAWQPEIRLNFE